MMVTAPHGAVHPISPREPTVMLLIASALIVILALAGLVAVFAAFPDRGESIPRAAWLSDAIAKVDGKQRP